MQQKVKLKNNELENSLRRTSEEPAQVCELHGKFRTDKLCSGLQKSRVHSRG